MTLPRKHRSTTMQFLESRTRLTNFTMALVRYMVLHQEELLEMDAVLLLKTTEEQRDVFFLLETTPEHNSSMHVEKM